jgi:hypothetical protein
MIFRCAGGGWHDPRHSGAVAGADGVLPAREVGVSVHRRITVLLAVAASLLTAVPAAAAPPASDPPGGLRVTGATATTVGLAWSPASGATGYQVLRGTPTTSLAVVASLGSSRA